MGEKSTHLTLIRLPTRKEIKENQAEVVFERQEDGGRKYKIFAAVCYESWEQWGAPTDVLWDNVATVESWRRGRLEIKPKTKE